MDLQLTDRIALVTAASQGLGFATARQLAREGAQVVICSRNDVHLQAAADAILSETGQSVLAIAADVTNEDDVKRLFDRVVDEFGGVDILVTNAGGPPSTRFEDTTMKLWRDAIDQLLISAVLLVRAGLPHLRQSTVPSVLTIASLSVKQPISNFVLSNSVRMSVIGLTKSLAIELGAEGIRFNSILPGWIETERIHDLIRSRAELSGRSVEDELERQMATIPMGRMGTPEEFANAAVFLCSPAASYLSGLMLNVDGASYNGVY